ncbi:MAG TPA: holdfast anchoring protein HfaA [Rhizomicrobium sp.]|nr:holdfast anchoring protein HfaA [Rhizomicrobium sp.]
MSSWQNFTAPKIVAFGLFLIAGTTARAADWTNSASYNGYSATTQNQASNYSMRDASGNLTLVNGQVTSSTYSYAGTGAYAGAQSSGYAGGVGVTGTPNSYGQATAIGNQLNVVVVGSHNTTIVNSSQVNNGNQTATADLNRH